MDSFELNKIAGAVIATLLGVWLLSDITKAVVAPQDLEQSVYQIEGIEYAAVETNGGAGAAVEEVPFAVYLAQADIARGQKVFNKCRSCHLIEEGASGARQGPNLWGTAGNTVAHVDGFSYSSAMVEHGGVWDIAALDAWLERPKDYIPGTKMNFIGLRDDQDRADMIAFMNSAGGTLTLPTAADIAPAVEEAPAGDMPAGDMPAGDMPAGDAPAEEAPADDVPADDAADDDAADDAAADDAAADDMGA